MSNDWAPIEIRVYPASSRAASEASVTVSGFASIVISASSPRSKRSRSRVSSARRSAGATVVGVPPPRNTLTNAWPPHAGDARSASRSTASRYEGFNSSRPAYALKSQ